MSPSIEEKLPSDILDEIVVADQTHVLEYFEDGDYDDSDLKSFVDQVRTRRFR